MAGQGQGQAIVAASAAPLLPSLSRVSLDPQGVQSTSLYTQPNTNGGRPPRAKRGTSALCLLISVRVLRELSQCLKCKWHGRKDMSLIIHSLLIARSMAWFL